MSDLQEDASEWDSVVCLPIIDISQNYKEELSSQELQFVTCQQLNEYIFKADISQQLPNIKSESKSTNVQRLAKLVLCCCVSNLNSNLKLERDRLFAIAIQSFSHQDKFHCQCLYTIYSKLTGNVINGYRRFGHHWEEIGFQGTDPSTDFRGVGIMGLFQLTFFVVSPEVGGLCKEIYDLSLDQHFGFPFALMSMNISQLVMQILREGLLNRLIAREKSVLNVLNRFYFGTFFAFYKVWTEGKKTIVDTGYVLKDLRLFARKNVNKLTSEYSTNLKHGEHNKCEDDFTNIGNVN